MKKHIIHLLLLTFSFTLVNCGIYSFSGISISPDVKTFQVNRFENTSLLFEPGLDLQFQNALQDLIQNQTNLSLVTTNGDLTYEGEITNYRISPTTATSQNTAAQNRLTITVKVRFFNKKKEDDDLDQSFSFFYDYDGAAQLVGAQKATAHEEIFDRLTQDILNATLAKW
ncbi:LptE family protein [Aestuariibaculum sediminum]|uniref:LptE family protein n=1 Tax=Aestuariibaculum sediminum TaxID=2770637 RepID=A0A8J6U857_9FLAO|nr:LptE family protein [Aestuariibaculum sediminum]MBD0832843.1 LptE family protein [Aestuariibaculum sediminum]